MTRTQGRQYSGEIKPTYVAMVVNFSKVNNDARVPLMTNHYCCDV